MSTSNHRQTDAAPIPTAQSTAQSYSEIPTQTPTTGQGAQRREKRMTDRNAPLNQAVPTDPSHKGLFAKAGQTLARLPKSGSNMATELSGMSPKAFRTIVAITIAFLVIFLMVSASAVKNVENRQLVSNRDNAEQKYQEHASIINDRIESQIKWMNSALALRGTPAQTVNVAARGPNISGAAVINSAGSALAVYPNTASNLASLPIQNLPKAGVSLTSLVSQGGVANPVIIQKSGDTFLAISLMPGTFVNFSYSADLAALVAPGGRVIDGNGTIATDGVANAFQISSDQLVKLSTQVDSSSIQQVSGTTNAVYLTAAKVPNTDLTMLVRGDLQTTFMDTNLPAFMILFLCTAALVSGLLLIAMRQLKTIHKAHAAVAISQDRYRVAVDGGRGGVWEIDLKNNSVYLNASLARLLGLTDNDQNLTVSQFLGLFHAADRERLLAMSRRAHLQGDLDLEVRVAHLPIVLQCRGNASSRNVEDGTTVIVGVAMDVTEQRGAQARLQAAEARLYDALNSMSDSFVVWDPLERLILWNGKFVEFFGFEGEQLQPGIPQNIIEQFANKSIEEFVEIPDSDDSLEIKLKDGRWVRYTEATTSDGGKVSIGTDITELRSREYELRENDIALRNTVDVLRKSQGRIMELADNYEQEKIRAEEANQSKSDFLANMSHELRTPLNAINGFSDIMKKEMFGPLGDPRYKEYVSDILFSGQHLLSLINDILDMSKIEAGKMTLNTDMLQINEMINQVVRIVRGRADDGRLKLVYEGTDFAEIEADQRAVKQVLLNLITNAIKFTPEGGTVTIAAERKQAGVIIRITDSGIGISQENIDRLAKPFEQIDTEHSKQQEGTGLGLALSKSLIELHGGNFLMESELGVGTSVTFTLPNTPPKADAAPDEHQVGEEINQLAQDIANVLGQTKTSNAQTVQPTPYPNAPAQRTGQNTAA